MALLTGVTLSAGGCASGGSDTGGGGGGDDGGTGGDVAISDGAHDAGCAAGKTKCGTTCTSTSTDPKNCGRCGLACAGGEVCSKGTCGFSCSPPETLCGGPSEAGSGSGSGSGGDSSAGDDGGGDGAADDATLEGGGSQDATVPGDGGTVAPYCSNLSNDPANCGTCGNNCGANATCSGGQCAISCPTGKKVCFANNSCISNGSCCQSGDCTITGEVCPMPGGTCSCPTGEKECTANMQCISTMACCTNADCTVTGQTCATPGQPCKCNASLQCCVAADCGPEANVATYTCGAPQPANKCGIGSCKPGCYDLDSTYADGCECCDDTYGHTCAAATDGGALMLGQTLSYTGQIPTPTGTDWFTVTFNNEGNTAFHGLINLVQTGTEFVFDVVQGSCTGGAMSCGEGGSCTGKTTWEESYGGVSPAGDPNSHTPAGASNFTPIMAVGKVYIKVYRQNMSSAATCTQFSLNISE